MRGGAGGAAALCSTPVSQRAPSEREPGLPSQGEAGLQPQPPRLARRAHPQTLRGWRVVHRRTASLAGDRAVTQGQPSEGLCVPPVTTAAGSEWQGWTRSRALPSPRTDGSPLAGKGNWVRIPSVMRPSGWGLRRRPLVKPTKPRDTRPEGDHVLTVQAKFCRPELQTGSRVDAADAARKSWGSELFGFRNSNRRRGFVSLSARRLLPEAAAPGRPRVPPPVPRAPTGQLHFLPACPKKNRPAPANDSPAVLLEPQLAHL